MRTFKAIRETYPGYQDTEMLLKAISP